MIQDKPLAATELERPAMALRTLPNGVRLLALPMPHLQSVSVGVFLRVGSRDETDCVSKKNSELHKVILHLSFVST
jgi:predicted Zn-dependent peptidase